MAKRTVSSDQLLQESLFQKSIAQRREASKSETVNSPIIMKAKVDEISSMEPERSKVVKIEEEDAYGDFADAMVIEELQGHKDYSFASAWHPDGHVFATGNLLANDVFEIMGMAEPADFVHIFDVGSDYTRRQELDFISEISGLSFSPDAEALFVGIWDRTYGSLLQYTQSRSFSYLDSLI